MILSLSSSGAAADPPPPSESPRQPAPKSRNSSLETVTVEATKQRKLIQHQISTFVSSITIPARDESLARWRPPVCPSVAGLPRDKGEFVLGRLSQVARDAGIPLAPEKCAPNFLVVVTREPQVLLEKWWARSPRLFNTDRGVGGIKRFISTPRPIRVWYNANSACGGGGGEASFELQAGMVYPSCSDGALGSRLVWDTVRQIHSVIVVIDLGHIEDLNMGQMADYIAMIGFAQIRENAQPGAAPTILRLFADSAAARPQSLSSWDQAFLKSLYATDSSNVMQMAQIKFRLFQDLAP